MKNRGGKRGRRFFFLSDTCSFWLVLGTRYTLSAEYKRKKWKKKKRKKKGTSRDDVIYCDEKHYDSKRKRRRLIFLRAKSCMFILLKITRLGISETRQIEHVVKIWIYRSSFRNNLRYWYAMLRSLYFNCTETIFIYIEKLLDEIIIIKNQHIIILKFAISLFINSM